MRLGFGLITVQHHPDDQRSDGEIYREAIEIAEELDVAGFDSIWTSEHHFVDDGYLPSQLPLIAAMAARTTRIRLGTGVLLAPMFDPLRLAEDAAVVDLISAGRLELGLGIGWREEEFDGFGVSMRERGARLDGHLAVLRQAWSAELVTGHDPHFAYPGLNVTPKPAQPGGPPIWLGAGAEAAVRRAGRVADGYLAGPASPDGMARRRGWVREAAEAVGRDPDAVRIGLYRPTFVWRDGDAWSTLREAAWYMDWKYGDMESARGKRPGERPPPMPADDEERLRRQTTVGTPEQVVEELRAYAEVLGPTGLFVARGHFPGLDREVEAESRRLLAQEVLPHIPGG